jgi:UPF0716 protein FxsA
VALLRRVVFSLIAIGLVDLVLLVIIASQIGFWPTAGIAFAASVIGGWLVKRQVGGIWREWREAGREGRAPRAGIEDGVVVMAAAVAMLLPGLITDVIGLVLLVPPVRRRLGAWLAPKLKVMVRTSTIDLGSFDRFGRMVAAPRESSIRPATRRDEIQDAEIIDAEIIEDVRRPSRA